jgi:hypothetical protein
MAAQVVRLESQGPSEEESAPRCTLPGLRAPQRPRVLARTVQTRRLWHGRLHRDRGPRPRRVPGAFTVPPRAAALGVPPPWGSHLMNRGPSSISRDEARGRALWPERAETLEAFRQLRDGPSTARRS